MKIHKRITAGVLAAALCATLPGMDSFRVLAGQEAEEGKFTTKNLIVSTANENFDTLGAGECLNLGEGLYALSYADEKSTESTYKAYRGMEGIDFVDINSVVNIQTEEMQEEMQKEAPEDTSLTENSKEDVSEQKEDSIKTKEEETEEHPEPEEEPGNQKELQKEEEISLEEPDTEQEETKAASDTEQEEADIKEAEQEDDILRVALLDTGVKADTGNLASYIEDTGVNLTDIGDAGSTVDDNGHGTSMAQVLVSALEENGKNSDSVKILPVKVLDASGCGTTLSAYQGIKAAIGQGADIICLGFSGKGESILLEQAVNDAYETGIPVLAPAGNDGEDILAYVPGCYGNAVVIGSAKNKKEADESNHGDTVDFAAYGTKEVLSLTGEMQTVKGTSISCAYVTGVAASFKKGLSCEEMETELVKKAVPTEDEGLKPYFGKGLIGEVPEAVQETAVEEETAEKEEATAAEGEETEEITDDTKKAEQEKKAVQKTTEEKSAALEKEESRYGYKGNDGYYYFPQGTTPTSVQGYQLTSKTTITCEHSADDDGLLYFRCDLKKIKPGKSELKDLKNYSYSDSFKNRITLKVVDLKNSEIDALGTNKAQVAHYRVDAYIGDVCLGPAAAPYKCESDHYHNNKKCGYAGYVYYSYKIAKCSRDGNLYEVKVTQKWQHCTRAGINPAENVDIYNGGASHKFDRYTAEENKSTISYNANGGAMTESDGIHFGNSKYFKLNSSGYVTSSDTKNGAKTKVTKTVKYTSSASNLFNVGTFGIKKTGYHVVNGSEWNTKTDGTGTIYDQKKDYSPTQYFPDIGTKTGESKTLYVNWVINKSTLNVNPNGGTWNNSTATKNFTKNYNQTLSIPVPTITNYTVNFNGNGGTADTTRKTTNKAFSSWSKSSTFYGSMTSTTAAATYTFGATDNVTSTITAQWTGSYNITLPGATRTGYDLLGWSTSSSATKPDTGYTPGATVTVSANKTLYAVWKLKTYTITYNANGGTGTMEPGIKTYFDTYTIKKNAFIRPGYDFLGWSRTKEGPAEEKYAEGKEYNTNADLTLYAQWRENFKAAYIGNGQTKGSDFIDEGENRLGHSEEADYTFDANTKKTGEEADITLAHVIGQANTEESLKTANEQFEKEETVTYEDSETGEKVEQKITGTVVGWNLGKTESEKIYGLGDMTPGTKLVSDAKEKEEVNADAQSFTIGSPNSDYGQFDESTIQTGIKTTYGAQQGAVLQNLGVGTVYNGTPYVNLYADWDMGPVIEAYDRYYTLEEAQGGIITEDELLNAAKATDEELKSSTNPDGKLKNHEDAENGTSFVVYDYQAEEFTELNGSAVISVTYRAEDAAGNVTRKMIMVHIVDGHDTIIDGHDIGVDPDEGEVRFISEDYLDTLDADSVWVNNPEYAALLEETVKIKRVDPERSEAPEALKAFGDKYTVAIPGTGTWTKEPKYVWNFTHEQTQEVKDFIEEHGPSNFVEKDALKTFLNEFADCMEQ